MIPPPPPPMSSDTLEDDEALGSMLISWYMSGYHTGYYLVQLFLRFTTSLYVQASLFINILLLVCITQGLKQGRREAAGSKKSHHK